MKKRIMSLLLVLVLLFTMTACSFKKEPKTCAEVVDAVSKLELNYVEATYDVTVDDTNVGIKMEGANASSTEGYVDFKVKFNSQSFDEIRIEDYTYVTTMIIKEDGFYINLASILDCVANLDEQYASTIKYLALPGDYLKITKEDVETAATMLGMDASEVSGLFATTEGLSEADAKKLSADMLAIVKDYLTDIEKAGNVITVADGKIAMNVNKSNCKEFMETMANLDWDSYIDRYATVMEQIPSLKDSAADFRETLADTNSMMKEGVQDFNAEEFGDSNISFKFGLQDFEVAGSKKKEKGAVMNADISVVDEYTNVNLSLDMNIKKAAADESKLNPESVMTFDQLLEMLKTFGLGF